MSGYETEELGRIEDALDAIESPTSEDVFQATRPYDERAIASVAAARAGGGGSSPFLVVTKTLTNAEILALPDTGFEILAPSETLNYAAEPTELPIPIMATAWLIKPSINSYGNVSSNAVLGLYWGSDLSVRIAYVLEIVATGTVRPGGDFGFNNYSGAAFNNTAGSWPMSFLIAPQFLNGENYQDNGIYLTIEDPDFAGDMTGGDPANTLKVEVVYRLVARS